ncbi:MAG: hypothetical protein JXA87_02905 [Thermoleophilia bacterium]|nr:hypothetical protein [Thermoleophilia bacterium]
MIKARGLKDGCKAAEDGLMPRTWTWGTIMRMTAAVALVAEALLRGSAAPRLRSAALLGGCVALLVGGAALLAGCSDATLGTSPSLSETTSASQAVESPTDPTVTATTPEDAAGLTSYTDRRNRFVIHYPASWQETNLRQLGDADVYGIEVVGFADHHGPMADGCYSNMIQVNILEDRAYDDSVLSRLSGSLPETLERLGAKNDEVRVLEPWKETEIAGVPAMTMKLSIFDDGQTFSGLDCVLVAGQRVYELEFFTAEADWERYEPLFRRILAGFEVDAG